MQHLTQWYFLPGAFKFLQDPDQFDTFLQYLQKEAGVEESEEIKTITNMISRQSQPPSDIA